jgi:hypothetical protein
MTPGCELKLKLDKTSIFFRFQMYTLLGFGCEVDRNKRILVVDDDPDITYCIKIGLEYDDIVRSFAGDVTKQQQFIDRLQAISNEPVKVLPDKRVQWVPASDKLKFNEEQIRIMREHAYFTINPIAIYSISGL